MAQSTAIRFQFPTHANDTVVLAHYFKSKIFATDTLFLNEDGIGSYSSEVPLPQGIYSLYFNPDELVDFLIGKDQQLRINRNEGQLKISGAKESQWFQNYLDFLNKKKKEAARLRANYEQADVHPDSAKIIRSRLDELDKQVSSFWDMEAQKASGTFYGKFVASNKIAQLDTSEIPVDIKSNDSLLWIYQHNFRKKHYWDYFDLTDPRMWRTPMLQTKLDEYFNEVLIPQPDSVLPVAIALIESSRKEPEVFQNLTSYILNHSVQSKYLGMENVFVALAERYYLSGEAFWVSEKTLENIQREVYFRKNNLVGSEAKELFLEGLDEDYHSLHQIATPYTILVFWEPNCGHCKKQIPELYDEVYLQTDPSLVTIMAVYTQDDKAEWQNFIDEHELDGWIHVWDPNRLSNFQVNYNTRTTPMIYLLDEDKKIIAKKLTVEQVKEILLREEKNQ